MSIIRSLTRIAAVEALIGKTMASDRVFDSAVTPIDQRITKEKKPFITVTSDDESGPISGKAIFHGERMLDLVIEIAIGSKVEVSIEGEGNTTEVIEVPHTDPATELLLDIFEDQVLSALMGAEQWALSFRKLMPVFKNYSSRRGAQAESGIRFAARQLVISGDQLDRPTDGSANSHVVLSEILPMLDAVTRLSPCAKLIRQQLSGSASTDWDKLLKETGFTGNTPIAIGIALEDGVISGSPIETITVEDEDQGSDIVIVAES